jgi:F-type H+-transporting ATPase subunit b
MKMPCFGLVSGHRFRDAVNPRLAAPLRAGLLRIAGLLRPLLVFALLVFVSLLTAQFANPQEQPAAQPSTQSAQPTSAEPAKKEDKQAASERKSIGGQLAEETREATGAEEEEHADLKHAAPIRWLARKTGLSSHGAHLVLISVNFAIIVAIVFWAVRKFVPGMLRNRSASIQRALEEARAASQDANRRLAEIENRLRQLDVEIGHMQAAAEKEGDAEEVRIQQAAEEDMRKVVLAAEQEIAAAAKQARRELTTHTAGLAIALARKQINVDSNTDQVLVRIFAAKLAAPASHKPASHKEDDGGKDGR